MKRFIKICGVLVILCGCIGAGCLIAAISMGATLPSSLSNRIHLDLDWNFDKSAKEKYTFSKDQVTDLDIDIGSGTLTIIKGDTDQITLENSSTKRKIRANVSDGCLEVEQQSYGWFHFHFFNRGTADAVLTIPKDMSFDEVTINLGSGNVRGTCAIEAREMDVECGSGDVNLSDFVVNHLNIELGSGDITLGLVGREMDYGYDMDLGSGDVRIGSQVFSGDEAQSHYNASKDIDIECGSGDININFIEEGNHHE